MNIHELNNFTGTLGSGAYLAIDDGTDTGKISSQGLLAATEARIDNIIAGPAPSAEEIVDARLGADGVPYPTLGDAIRDQFTDLKAEINDNTAKINNNTAELSDVIGILQHPISFANSDVSTTGYFTTVIPNVQMVKGVVYDITATLETATTQASYLLLYKGETSVQSTTLAAGNTTATFYLTPSESGDDYSVSFASGAYATPLVVSATVVPRSHGSVIDDITSEQDTIAERQALNSTIINNATTKRYYSANMYDGEYVADQYVNKDGVIGNSYSYGYTKNLIRVDEGDNITIGDGGAIRTMRFVTAYGADYEPISAKGAESVNAYVVPSGVKYIRISAAIGYFQCDYFTVQNSAALLPYDTYNAEDVPIDSRTYHDKHFVVSSNLFDGEYISGKGIKQDGTLFSDNNYGVTKNFIPVDAGDDIVATSNNGIRFMRFIAAYDQNYKVLPNKGLSGGTYSYWTVPDGVYFIKVTSQATVISANDYAIYRSKGVVFDSPDTFNIVETNNRDLLRMKHEPLRLMPDYITDTLSYRPIGSLSKGYICMITDDGTAGLASYTIPLAISENIPMTFAVMKGSEVFADASMTATVLDAVNNHNCSLAQHGGKLWDLMSEIDLNNFFDDEKAYFDTLGVELRGAVIPQHRTNSLVKAVAGARFGVVRSGYTGLGPSSGGDVDNGSIRNYYDYYTSGARSNIYGLSSYNCAYASTAYNHAAVDYAKANNKIMVVYFHEFDTYAEQQAVVEDLISYAKTIGLEFITLGDIPTLETWVAD